MSRPIPTPDVALCDPKTGLMTTPWFNYFKERDRGAIGASGGSNIAAWYYGTAAPANTLGIDGDFYIQQTGTAVAAIYIKKSGVWT